MMGYLKMLDVVRYSMRRKLPNSTGIYFVVLEQKIIYIGIALDIKQRFTYHAHHNVFGKLNPLIYYEIFAGLSLEELRPIESRLIKKYMPCFNERVESGEKIFRIEFDSEEDIKLCKELLLELKQQMLVNTDELILRALQLLNQARSK